MTRELYNHCQCDNCTGEDCGQDDPEEYEKEQAKERADIRQAERDKVLSLIRCFIEHEGFNCGETDAIKEYMKELRQQAGEP
jgi:hypothetical protein